MAGASSGRLFLDGPALLIEEADGVRLVHPRFDIDVRADGELAAEIVTALDGGSAPLVELLGIEHPLAHSLAALAKGRWQPLTRAALLRLGGFDTLFVELTGQCNERCLHCYADSSPDVRLALATGTLRHVIEDAAALGFSRLQLTGGDPLLHPDLLTVVAQARQLGIGTCEIYTNGLALTDALVDSLHALGASFAFSFYSADAAVHDAITQVPGSQQRTLDAMRRTLARGLEARAAVVVMQENAASAAVTLELLQSIGLASVGVSASHAVGRGQHYAGGLPSVPRDTHRNSAEDPTRQGSGSLAVLAGGEVTPCIFNRDDLLGRVPQRRLRDIVETPAVLAATALDLMTDLATSRGRLQCPSCQVTALGLRALTES